MAKSKITYEWSDDGTGRSCLLLTRKTGKITWSEALELLHEDYQLEGRYFILELHLTGYLPEDLYDEGDIWVLYEPDDYFKRDYTQRLRPLKPKDYEMKFGDKCLGCPTCENPHLTYLNGTKMNYCPQCGQELDWMG